MKSHGFLGMIKIDTVVNVGIPSEDICLLLVSLYIQLQAPPQIREGLLSHSTGGPPPPSTSSSTTFFHLGIGEDD